MPATRANVEATKAFFRERLGNPYIYAGALSPTNVKQGTDCSEAVQTAAERVLGHRHELHVGEPVGLDVVDELRLEDVAAHVYLSPYYFSKLFKKYQGIGFNAWVNHQRMVSAKELLCHSDWSIASIARNLGFSQTSYFCKVFRQAYQVTPQAYRQQINARSQTESF